MAKGNWKAWEAKGNVEKGESQRAVIFSLYVWAHPSTTYPSPGITDKNLCTQI